MNVIDNILMEWAYRCSDGIVDLNNPEKVKILNEILKSILKEDIDDDILNALSNLDPNDPKKEKILAYITGNTKDEKDQEIEKLKQQIEGSEKEKKEIAEKIYKIEQELISKNLKESTVSYIIYSFLKQDEEKALIKYFDSEPKLIIQDNTNIKEIPLKNLPEDIVNKLYDDLSGSSGTKGVGKEENFLVTFYKNVKKLEKKGDIEVDGQKYEVKGVGAMVTPPDTGRGSKKDVIQLLSTDFLPKLDPSQLPEEIFKKNTRWINTISALYKNYSEKDFFIKELNLVLNSKYPGLTISSDILKDPDKFSLAIAKNLISNFDIAKDEKIMFVSPDGNIKIYNTPEDLINAINKNEIKISSFSDFVPRLTLPKEKLSPQKEKVEIQKKFIEISKDNRQFVSEEWINRELNKKYKTQFDCTKKSPKNFCLLKPDAAIEIISI